MIVVWRRGDEGPEFLVLERSPERQGYWHLVAGGLEEGEEGVQAAARELREETGLDGPVEDLGLRYSYPSAEEPTEKQAALGPGVTEIAVASFVAKAPRDWEPSLNEEHVAYRWCTEDDAVSLLRFAEPRDALRKTALRLGACS